ncbi:hypothetical protein BABINDRAFT_175404 [Babjeviella inositovora NRRL Y-12698]|uniref:Uncharacterized protein n=1 Tax=Babjeviella inositovora NRRL Y-12698 TaxID=984486 RepID=A0A1E3QSQ9_9ASCO|nr:uncharacterized protein BABINDRAFT_175404 [Babjeviella inositovora NRRL Y-12698]ODQ80746.1 hypothetical protein BABINDRAFT_175404 [Babjeviella inositovora NRRL Y-12698]
MAEFNIPVEQSFASSKHYLDISRNDESPPDILSPDMFVHSGTPEQGHGCFNREHTPIRPSHIISPIKQDLPGYMCVGVVESPSKLLPQNEQYHLNKVRHSSESGAHYKYEDLTSVREFPASFQPRATANMHHKEKVSNWLLNVPVYKLSEGEWTNDCYPGVVNSESESSGRPEVADVQDVIELQARRITYYASKCYFLDPTEPTACPEMDYDGDADDEDDEEIYVQQMDSMMDAMDHEFDQYDSTGNNYILTHDKSQRPLSRMLSDEIPRRGNLRT